MRHGLPARSDNRLEQVRDITDERFSTGDTPNYSTLDARVGRTFRCFDLHYVSLGLENISDKNYQVHGSGVFGNGFASWLEYNQGYLAMESRFANRMPLQI